MTKILDKEAFRRFTPKEMHEHIKDFDDYLSHLKEKDASVKNLIENPFALFPAQEVFPIVHVTALRNAGRWHYFSSGRSSVYKRREGHRFVSQDGGDSLEGMQPLLRLEVVSDPSLVAAFDVSSAKKLLGSNESDSRTEMERLSEIAKTTLHPAVVFSAPLAIMKNGTAERFRLHRFTLYQHILGDGFEYPDDGLFYIGITSREWKRRWAEHRAAIMRGSRLKFHRAYGDRLLQKRLTFVHHKVMGVFTALDQVQDLEEAIVAGHWDDARLLNMIPGGKAGIKYLHEHVMLARKAASMPEHVEAALEGWLRHHPRKGLPAPWVAKNWEDEDFALKIICGPEGRLSIDQVLQIRVLAEGGLTAAAISVQIGAKNVLQVQRVMGGTTYGRVR